MAETRWRETRRPRISRHRPDHPPILPLFQRMCDQARVAIESSVAAHPYHPRGRIRMAQHCFRRDNAFQPAPRARSPANRRGLPRGFGLIHPRTAL